MSRFHIPAIAILLIALLGSQIRAENPASHPSSAVIERHLHVSSGTPELVDAFLTEFQQYGQVPPSGDSLSINRFMQLLKDVGLTPQDLSIAVNFPDKRVDLTIHCPQDIDPQKASDQLVQGFIRLSSSPGIDSLPQRIDEDRFRLTNITNGIDVLKAQQHDSVQALRIATGAIDLSPASVRELVEALQKEKEAATIDLAAKGARRDALAEQISKFSGQIQDKIKNDPIAAELAKVVDARQKEFDRFQENSKAGAVTQSAVDQAMADLAEAKAKLLERQEAAANAAGGDVVAGWNRDLMNLSVDVAELAARSKALDDRLAAYASADNYINNADQWATQIADLQKQVAPLEEKIRDEEADYDRNHVSIDVIKPSFGSNAQPSK